MNLEISVLYKLIKENNIDILLRTNIKKELFEENRDLFEFIQKFYDSYAKFPDMSTISRYYPNKIDLDLVNDEYYPEPLEYYVDLLKKKKEFELLRDFGDYISEHIKDGIDKLSNIKVNAEQLLIDIEKYTQKSTDLFVEQIRNSIIDDYKKKKEANGLLGIPYRWNILNLATGGIQPYLTTISGRFKIGKTFFLCCILLDILSAGKKVLLFSREMSSIEMLNRLVAIKYKLNFNVYKHGKLTPEVEDDFQEKLSTDKEFENLIINEDLNAEAEMTTRYIKNRTMLYKPDYVIIDGVYLLSDNKHTHNKVEKLYNITRDLKIMSRQLSVGVIGTVQEKRDKKEAGEIGWSTSFSQDSDLVISIQEKDGDPRIRKVSITAIRNGEPRDFYINFLPNQYCNFDENSEASSPYNEEIIDYGQ